MCGWQNLHALVYKKERKSVCLLGGLIAGNKKEKRKNAFKSNKTIYKINPTKKYGSGWRLTNTKKDTKKTNDIQPGNKFQLIKENNLH